MQHTQGVDMGNKFLTQAIKESLGHSKKYIAEHNMNSMELLDTSHFTLPIARYQLILEAARVRLYAQQYSVKDIRLLVECYQGYVCTPDRFSMMASDLCDSLYPDLDEYKLSGHCELVERVHALDLVLKIALVDALEQLWNRGMTTEKAIVKHLRALGILLRP
jgi:hypothetical protein